MGRVMGCGLCPYNAIEKVGNYVIALFLCPVAGSFVLLYCHSSLFLCHSFVLS